MGIRVGISLILVVHERCNKSAPCDPWILFLEPWVQMTPSVKLSVCTKERCMAPYSDSTTTGSTYRSSAASIACEMRQATPSEVPNVGKRVYCAHDQLITYDSLERDAAWVRSHPKETRDDADEFAQSDTSSKGDDQNTLARHGSNVSSDKQEKSQCRNVCALTVIRR